MLDEAVNFQTNQNFFLAKLYASNPNYSFVLSLKKHWQPFQILCVIKMQWVFRENTFPRQIILKNINPLTMLMLLFLTFE